MSELKECEPAMENDKLERCPNPKCNGAMPEPFYVLGFGGRYGLKCNNCGRSVMSTDPDESLMLWNTRATPPPQDNLVEAAMDLVCAGSDLDVPDYNSVNVTAIYIKRLRAAIPQVTESGAQIVGDAVSEADAETLKNLMGAQTLYMAYDLMEHSVASKLRAGLTEQWGDEKTEYETGFCHAYHHILDLAIELGKHLGELSHEQSEAITKLSANGVVYPSRGKSRFFISDSESEEPITFFVLISDTFAWACADSEDFDIADAPLLWSLYQQFGYDGIVAWVAVKRNAEPIEPRITDKYKAARAVLPPPPAPPKEETE